MSRRRAAHRQGSTKDAEPFDADGEHIKHTQIGVWDLYEDKRPQKERLSSSTFLQRLDEVLTSLPYVLQAVTTLALLCYYTLMLYLVAVLITSVLPATTLYYSGQLLHVVQSAIDTRSVDKTLLFRVLFYRVACATLRRLANLAQNWANIRIASKMRTHYAEHILHAHVRLDVPTYEDPATHGLLSSVVSSRSNVAWAGIRALISTVSTAIQLVTQLLVLLNVLKDQPDGTTLALLSFAEPVLTWIRRPSHWRGGVWAATCRNSDYLRLQGLKHLVDDGDYRKELVAGNLEHYIQSEFRAVQQRLGEDGDLAFYEARQQMQQKKEAFSLLSFLSHPLQELPQVVFTFRAVQSPRSIPVSLASLTLIRQTVASFATSLTGLFSQTSSMSETFASIRRLYEIVHIENHVIDGTKPYPENQQALKNGMAIEFVNVSFKYPGADDDSYAIRNVSFKIGPGQLCVLVGFNGSGKSTVLKLLNRLYDPTEGSILIDGRDIKTLRLSDLRRCISVLFQDYTHFPLSIKENIGMGDPDHAWDEDRVRQAAQLGGALDLVTELPEGFDTFLSRPVLDYYSGLPEGSKSLFGRPIEYGRVKKRIGKTHNIELSGGQMQRIAVSRTFMRSLGDDSRVGLLLFDEPSASLDPTAEHDLFDRLRRLRGSKTMVFSSHRFGQLTKSADLILYMANSTVLELGSHEELLKQEGGYAEMYNIQAAQFR
ncbi:P-loop containing nucleoside triphosphate hydrolase protein [Ramaria rubella]|nr:P-loop containing nucleoside triphosphate hydrolase protein [Ramaria rubella]